MYWRAMHPVAYPLAFGHWSVQGRELVCRLPRRTVAVTAPGRLLREVLRLCDGRLRWRDVAAQLARGWSCGDVESFLARLVHEGVLVEAGESLARWAELGQLPVAGPRAASEEEQAVLHRVAQGRLLPGGAVPPAVAPVPAANLAALLRGRQSDRSFDDAPVSADDLRRVLWAAHGVARPADDAALRWHRTVASGGNLHCMRWFVAVLRSLPGAPAVAPGLHEARFHVDGGVTLAALARDAHAAWRMVLDPRVLRYASALLLPVCDTTLPARKYGNRAVLFAHVEAGQSLQNAQLMAAALGLGAIVRGDTAAAAVLQSLAPHLQPDGGPSACWSVMPALALGAKASPTQLALARGDEGLEVGPACLPGASRAGGGEGFAFFAGPIAVGDTATYASGRAAEPGLALRKAEAEAWERRGWATLGPVLEGRWREIPGALRPDAIVAYTPSQYAAPGFPFRPFSARRRYLWVEAQDAASGASVRMPAECVHALSALPPAFRASALTNTSSSGVAAWTDAQGALSRATLELLERDAFARRWIARQPVPLLRPASLPGEARRRVAALEALGHRVAIALLASEPVPVLSAFVQHLRRPFTAITAGADFDAEAALAKALDEAEGRAAHAAAFPARPLASASEVQGPAEVNRYYQTPRFRRRADFFASAAQDVDFAACTAGSCGDALQLQSWLADRGLRLLAVDLTPAGAAIDQGRTPLKVVRAVVPGLLPFWFQPGLEPAGLAAFARIRRGPILVHPFT